MLFQATHFLDICVIDWLMIAYIALFFALLSRLTALACGSTWVTRFIGWIYIYIHRSGVLTALAWLVPHETAAVSAQVLCTPYNHAPCHFMQSHIRKVYACLAVTCHLRFWQNDRDLLRATVVTRGWNGYRNKSQYRKLTLEKKILPPLQQGFEPATFWSRVRRSNHWAIPAHIRLVSWCFEPSQPQSGLKSYQEHSSWKHSVVHLSSAAPFVIPGTQFMKEQCDAPFAGWDVGRGMLNMHSSSRQSLHGNILFPALISVCVKTTQKQENLKQEWLLAF